MANIFFISLLLVFFAYFGYPLTMAVIGKFIAFKPKRSYFFPQVTLIITAYNEEKRIRKKLENTILLDYPKEKLQVIVASDGSADKTNEIVRDFADRGIELLEVTERKGKENAQMRAIGVARGEIIVFSDVATLLDPFGVREIVSNFADPAIGCVSSEDKIVNEPGSGGGGEGFYVKYEMWLRGLESKVNSVVGLSGSFFAARKIVCDDFSPRMQSDFRTLLSSMRKGMRGISDPKAIGYYKDIQDASREFDRKVRTVIRGLTVFFNNLEFLNVFEFGIFSYQYICHKLLRWLAPFFLLIALVINALLAMRGGAFLILFILQAAFYGAALIGSGGRQSSNIFIKIPRFFVVVNTSILVAWIKYLGGERLTMWKPSER
ncbi:MAG: glycosyltransferase family 2 protein [Chitinivibrionales bacterium]|nr:glycosyltransferase family 2 protein [Chitinivibrionales bacterium]